MSLYIEPKGYRILIKQDEVDNTYGETKIVVVEDQKIARAATNHGTVVAVGNLAYKGFSEGGMWCEVGDRVVFAQYAGKTLTDPVTNEDYIIMNDEDIIAVLRSEDA